MKRAGRVLVVEDEHLVREIIVTQLRDAGYDVIEAQTGAEALNALQSAPPVDMLFTDIRLPGGLDGWTIAERAREIRPDLPIVYATGYTADDPRQLENSRFLTKPYRSSAVLAAFVELGVG